MSSNDKIEVIKLENESHDLPDENANKSQQYMPSNIARQRTQKHVAGMFQLPNNNTIYNFPSDNFDWNSSVQISDSNRAKQTQDEILNTDHGQYNKSNMSISQASEGTQSNLTRGKALSQHFILIKVTMLEHHVQLSF